MSGEETLLTELALIVDAGEHIAQFCNYFEGDGFLAPYAYDSWHKLNAQMSIISERYIEEEYPSSLRAIVTQLRPDDIDAQQRIMQLTLGKVKLVKDKLEYDTLTRLDETLKTLRGCRLVGFQFVKDTNIEALEEEVQFVQRLPLAVPMIDGLLEELPTYKRLADEYMNDNADGWLFWRRYCNSLPLWYKIAAEVALVMCSSAAVERIFSLLN